MERDSWLYLFLLITIGVVTATALSVLAQPVDQTDPKKGTLGAQFFGRIQNTLNWAITNIYGKPQS